MISILLRVVVGVAMCAGLVAGASAQRVLKVNESLGPGSPEEAALQHFKRLVEEASKRELQIAIHLQDALGKPDTALESLMTGSLDLYSGALEYYAQIVPQEINAISIPYLVKDHEALRKYLRSAVFKGAEKKLLDRGIRMISTEYNADRGPYRVIVSSKPIRSVDDVRDLKLRVFPNDVYVRAWKALGAVPVQLAWTETYLGIRQGVVHAVTSPLALVRSMKFTEVGPYVTEIREYPQTWPMTVSERTWQRLKPEQQLLLVRAANEAGKLYAKTTIDRAQGDIDYMKKANKAEFIRVDTSRFRRKLEPFYDSLVKEKLLSPEVYEAVKALN